jgi:hypothetical protein
MISSFLIVQTGLTPHRPQPTQVNLKTQLAKVTDTIEVTASGGDASEVLLCWAAPLAQRLSRVKVRACAALRCMYLLCHVVCSRGR